MNQGKLEVVKQEKARTNTNILEISELKWTGMGKLNPDVHYIYYCRQESLRINRVALIVIGEGNGNPLQCSCLENPRDSRAWWAAIYGVTQSRTQLKWLSSSSSPHSQQTSPKCSTWVQSQKGQNDLSSFPRETIQYHSNPSLFPNH